jgi:Ni/Co efflux regulator RcnB
MKNAKLLAIALVASVLVLQGNASAQPSRGNDGRNGCGRGDQGCERMQSRDRGRNDHQRGERGAGPDQSFYRGDHLPMNYRSRQYVVDDWRGHGLRSPPRGYHWVQTGGDYVLVAIATGAILELLLNH